MVLLHSLKLEQPPRYFTGFELQLRETILIFFISYFYRLKWLSSLQRMQMFPILPFLLGSTWCNFLSSLPILVSLLLLIPDDLTLKQTFELMNLPFHQFLIFFELQSFFDHLETPHLVLLTWLWGTAEVIRNVIGSQKSLWLIYVGVIRYPWRGFQWILCLVIVKSWFFLKVLMINCRLILNVSFYILHKIYWFCLRLGRSNCLCCRLSGIICWNLLNFWEFLSIRGASFPCWYDF